MTAKNAVFKTDQMKDALFLAFFVANILPVFYNVTSEAGFQVFEKWKRSRKKCDILR